MSSPTNVDFNDSVPPPKPDAFNVEWQATAPIPDPSSPGNYLRELSGCYRTPQVGGVLVLTDVYDLGGPDAGFTFVCNSASPFTVTHPAVIPVLPNPQGLWNFKIINLGAGTVTLDLNGLNLDGSGTNPTYATGEGAEISTDGTDLYTCLSSGTGGGGGSGTVTHTAGALTAHDVVVGNGTDDIKVIGSGTSGQFLKSAGSSADPAFANIAESDVTSLVADLALKAPLASPTFTGTPAAPTPTTGDDSTKIATTAFVEDTIDNLVAGDIPNIAESQVTSLVSDLALKAPLASPALTGTPTAPTAAGGTNTTQIATTAFVETELGSYLTTSAGATKAGVQTESYTYAADSGTANTYAVTLSPAPTLAAGSKVVFKAGNANTGASTLNVNAGGAKNIYKKTNSNLVSGDILANQIIEVVYDGTNFQLTGNGASGSSPLVIGFAINNGAAGTDVGPMLLAPRAGTISRCQIVTKASDGTTGLTFLIKQNGVSIFSSNPTVAAATASGTTSSSTSFTSSPLAVAFNDLFTLDILSGSPNWLFTAILET